MNPIVIGAADAVAPGSDEHAELRREHQAQLVRTQWLAQRNRKPACNMGGGALQRQIDKDVEDVRNRINEPKKNQGK